MSQHRCHGPDRYHTYFCSDPFCVRFWFRLCSKLISYNQMIAVKNRKALQWVHYVIFDDIKMDWMCSHTFNSMWTIQQQHQSWFKNNKKTFLKGLFQKCSGLLGPQKLSCLHFGFSNPQPRGFALYRQELKMYYLVDYILFGECTFFSSLLYAENLNRKAFKESVKPGWHYFGRKMVNCSYIYTVYPPCVSLCALYVDLLMQDVAHQ